MSNLRNRFERFCFNHRNWGIPNLMLYIAIGSAIVLIMSMFNGTAALYQVLLFDKAKILNGQVWRLFTYVFTDIDNGFLGLIFLYFFYNLGRHVELSMGTFRFNLFYFSGVILMDVFAMIFCPANPILSAAYSQTIYSQMAFYLHLSLTLVFAITYPDAQFLMFFIIPVKAWVLSLVYMILVLVQMANMMYPVMLFPHCLFPLVGLLNFLLFAGKDVFNLLPPNLRPTGQRGRKVKYAPPKRQSGPIPYNPGSQAPKQSAPYTHRCTVCGRTDVTNPELEFRYCSKCNGYHCYCEDHISNHTHIQ